MAGPILFATVIAVFGFVRDDYSHVKHHISQLGATGAPQAWVQNVNFVVTGLLIIAFAIGLYRAVGTGKAGKIGSALIVLVGVGAAGPGLFPEDMIPVPPEPTFSDSMHNMFSLLAFLAVIIAVIILSRSLPRDDVWQRYRPYSLITGIGAFALLVLAGLSGPEEGGVSALEPWTGLLQRLFVGVWLLWIEVMAIKLFRLAARPSIGMG